MPSRQLTCWDSWQERRMRTMKNEPEMIVFEDSDIAKIKGAQIIKVLTPYMAVFPNCKM